MTEGVDSTFREYVPSDNDLAKLEKNFTYHKPRTDQIGRYEVIRDRAKEYAEMLTKMCPPSCELSLALTNLEQCVMWANASIARNE